MLSSVWSAETPPTLLLIGWDVWLIWWNLVWQTNSLLLERYQTWCKKQHLWGSSCKILLLIWMWVCQPEEDPAELPENQRCPSGRAGSGDICCRFPGKSWTVWRVGDDGQTSFCYSSSPDRTFSPNQHKNKSRWIRLSQSCLHRQWTDRVSSHYWRWSSCIKGESHLKKPASFGAFEAVWRTRLSWTLTSDPSSGGVMLHCAFPNVEIGLRIFCTSACVKVDWGHPRMNCLTDNMISAIALRNSLWRRAEKSAEWFIFSHLLGCL